MMCNKSGNKTIDVYNHNVKTLKNFGNIMKMKI